ncbi:uncharacterized protein LOC111870496 [Cryptotermes secundus]|uniref:uncharacterized protein LOC111870496 n=1 Tax=Cryptotermes secundus TaxID=105785 RepID=UPI000CD7B745|nr:uncharacterized protein LOC111870496 [Cryptotermes secundus]
MTTKELKAVKSLRLNKEIMILRADKSNCTVVLDESEYKDKLNTLLESGVYETLPKDPTAKVERKVDDKFFQQKDGMAMGNSLSPIVSNIFMEHFEKLALDSAPYKPSVWLRYVDDTFVVWPHGSERLQTFFDHLNSLRPSICFTMETESNNAISFLDVLVIREKTALATQVYRKPTHTGQYLNFNSNHPPHVKRGLIKSLHDRASTICQDRRDLAREINNLRHDLQLNGYSKGFID